MPGRPGIGGGNRPGIGGNDRPGIGGNRPGLGNIGSGNIGGGNSIGQVGGNLGVVNRPNYGGNTVINNQISHSNWFGGGNRFVNHGGWGAGGRWGGYNWSSPYYGRHGGWYRGAWDRNDFGGWLGARGLGWANAGYSPWHRGYGVWGGVFRYVPTWSGYALAGWGLGTWAGSWLYSGYTNPYYVATPVINNTTVIAGAPAPVAYNYSQPIDVAAAPPEPIAVDQGRSTFDAAIDAFRAGDYPRATSLADQAIALTPDDPAAHEFRALSLFAQKRYDEAASALYAVLTNGPGWNWSTMIGLYPDAETYTAQFRALEAAVTADPNSAPDRFVLAYHYLVQGFADQAREQFQAVVTLQPKDQLAARFVTLLGPPPEQSAPAPSPGPSAAADSTASQPPPPEPPPANLLGRWQASPGDGVAIVLTLNEDTTFSWDVTAQGQTQTITGEAGYRDGVLSLAQAEGPPLAGKVEGPGAEGFGFQLLGDAQAPTLKFRR